IHLNHSDRKTVVATRCVNNDSATTRECVPYGHHVSGDFYFGFRHRNSCGVVFWLPSTEAQFTFAQLWGNASPRTKAPRVVTIALALIGRHDPIGIDFGVNRG